MSLTKKQATILVIVAMERIHGNLKPNMGTIQLTIPRDCNGNFSPSLLPAYGRRDDHLEEMVIKLYQTGVTTREISDIIERMYGHHYSPATISNISKAT